MHPLNPFFALIIFLIAFLTAYLIRIKYKIVSPMGRYETIDGMRGLLALSVFICHAAVWHQYLQIGKWAQPKSNLYYQFGQTSVTLFFMITSFLFISKLLHARDTGFNWKHFFISRIYRLAPMYYLSLALIVVSIMCASNWQIYSDLPTFFSAIAEWSFFTIHHEPNINNSIYTLVMGGVVWSLPYEWLFYFCLPLISLIILKNKPTFIYIILSIAFVVMFIFVHDIKPIHLYAFIGGAIAPILIKYTTFYKKISGFFISICIITSLYLIGRYTMVSSLFCLLLIMAVFTAVALGNTLFGLLKNPTLRFLGDICYSTYLLHGIILFTVYYWGFGLENVKNLSATEYCILVFCITPIVVIASFLGFKYIEKPFMDKAKARAHQSPTQK